MSQHYLSKYGDYQVDPPFESNILSKSSCLVKQGMEVEDELVKERRAEMVECKQGCHMIRRISAASLTLYCNLRNVCIVTICASLTVSNVNACLNNFPIKSLSNPLLVFQIF